MNATLPELTPAVEFGSIAYAEHLSIAPLPKSAHFAPGSTSLAQIGAIPVFRAAWGTPLPTDAIAATLAKSGQQTEVVSTLREIGFLGGYHFPIDTDMDTQHVQDLHVGYISGLVETVLHAHGWDSADALVICSHSIQQAVTGATAAELARRGHPIERVYWYRLACNSTTAALADFTRDPELLRPPRRPGRPRYAFRYRDRYHQSGHFCHLWQCRRRLAFVPGVEIELFTGRAVVEYDTVPFFLVPHAFNRPPASPRCAHVAQLHLDRARKRRSASMPPNKACGSIRPRTPDCAWMVAAPINTSPRRQSRL